MIFLEGVGFNGNSTKGMCSITSNLHFQGEDNYTSFPMGNASIWNMLFLSHGATMYSFSNVMGIQAAYFNYKPG